MRQDKGLSMISLAVKAGKAVSGEFCTEREVKSGRASLVLVAGDASGNTKKKFQDLCRHREVPFCLYRDKETLGHAMGKEFRASLAILDPGMAATIKRYIETEDLGDKEGGNANGEDQDL